MNIQRLKFSIDIQAKPSTIWNALWSDEGYRNWTEVFAKGSHALSDNWEEGTKVHFLGPDKNGIFSLIEKHVTNEIMKFKHIGTVKAGQEQEIDDETKLWSGTQESYLISEISGGYCLTIDIGILEEHVTYMSKTLPIALERVKAYCSV